MSPDAAKPPTTRDFCVGFEGEPQTVVEAVGSYGAVISSIRIWEGYFDALMERIPPGPEGWCGFMLPYHLHRGWYEDDVWADPDPLGTLNQMKSIDEALLDRDTLDVRAALVALLEWAVKTGACVRFRTE